MIGSKQQSGFVLVSTIWLTLVMLVFAGVFSFFANSELQSAINSKRSIQESLDRHAAEQALIYMFATHSLDRRGLVLGEELRLGMDGTIYQGAGDVAVMANDYAGLIGLNASTTFHLDNLLASFESNNLRRQGLIHTLLDYVDMNERPRLNGREAPGYRIENLPLPTNDYLKSTSEIRNVYGWSDWLDRHEGFDPRWLSTNWRSRVNINTLPDDLFLRVLNVSELNAEALLERRRRRPFENMADLNEELNIRETLPDDMFTFLPINKVRFSIFSANNRKMTTIAVLFTPFSVKSPWEIDYRYHGERDFDIAGPSRIVAASYFGGKLSAAE